MTTTTDWYPGDNPALKNPLPHDATVPFVGASVALDGRHCYKVEHLVDGRNLCFVHAVADLNAVDALMPFGFLCAVIVAGLLAIRGARRGWFDPQEPQ